MFSFLKNCTYPIGVDTGGDSLKLAQLGNNGRGINLIASGSENRPADVKLGSGDWQRWVIEAIRKLVANGKFSGRNIVAAIPASEVFIDHIKVPGTPKTNDCKLDDAIFSKIKQKLPFEPEDAMIKYIPTERDNILIIATERKIIDRHLAIYEKTNLAIKSIGVWPVALTNSYASFFGRRKADIEAIVMLLDIEANCTNVVICRAKTLLFARSIPIGVKQLKGEKIEWTAFCSKSQDGDPVTRLVLELTSCRRHFGSMHKEAKIGRLVFLSGQTVDRNVCWTIAKQLEIPAQMGNCLTAVEIEDPYRLGIDRRGCQVNWATAFGLSLS
jgi:Tfp pilus assembly PilM family ATPase